MEETLVIPVVLGACGTLIIIVSCLVYLVKTKDRDSTRA